MLKTLSQQTCYDNGVINTNQSSGDLIKCSST